MRWGYRRRSRQADREGILRDRGARVPKRPATKPYQRYKRRRQGSPPAQTQTQIYNTKTKIVVQTTAQQSARHSTNAASKAGKVTEARSRQPSKLSTKIQAGAPAPAGTAASPTAPATSGMNHHEADASPTNERRVAATIAANRLVGRRRRLRVRRRGSRAFWIHGARGQNSLAGQSIAHDRESEMRTRSRVVVARVRPRGQKRCVLEESWMGTCVGVSMGNVMALIVCASWSGRVPSGLLDVDGTRVVAIRS